MTNTFRIIILILSFCISFAQAQVKLATFKDGTKVEYEIEESTPDNGKKGMTRIGIGSIGVGYQYVQPGKFEADAGFSMFSGGYAGILWSVLSYTPSKKVDLSVKEISGFKTTTTYYISGENMTYNTLTGIHAGARYFNKDLYLKSPLRYVTDVLLEDVMFPYTGTSYFLGLGYLTTSHMKYLVREVGKTEVSTRSFTHRWALYADLMYYPKLKYDLYHPLHDQIEPYDEYRKLGFMVLFESTSVSSTSENWQGWGTAFQFGLGYGPAGVFGLLGYGIAF